MPIDPSISDLTWLTQTADPAKDLAAGASVGGHIAQSRLGFASLAQRAQEFQQEQGMRERQLGMQIAQEPLKQTLLQQEADLNAAKLATALQQRQDTVSSTKAFSGLASQVSPLLQDGQIDEAQNAIMAAGVGNAFLLNDPRFKMLYDFTTKAQEAKLELVKAKQNSFTMPYAVSIPSATPGEPPYNAVRTGPNSFTLPQSSVMSITTPDGTVVEQRTGAGGSSGSASTNGLNPAVASKLEQKLSDTIRSSSLLDESIGLISPENIGPRGKLGAAVEKGANIVSPGSMRTPITKAQTTFNTTAQAQYNSLKADSQINKLEAAAMQKIAVVTDWWEAAATAKEKYQTLRDLTGLQAVLASHTLNRIAPDDILKGMSLDFVNKYFDQKTITKAEMARWIDLHGGNDAVEKMLLKQQ